jgi:hypothetical protein
VWLYRSFYRCQICENTGEAVGDVQELVSHEMDGWTVKRAERQPQKVRLEIVGRMGSKLEPIKAESVSQYPTDAILIEQATAGNEWAFELLGEHFVYHHLARTEVIQDVVQLLPHER